MCSDQQSSQVGPSVAQAPARCNIKWKPGNEPEWFGS
jgi:hypothetical protein